MLLKFSASIIFVIFLGLQDCLCLKPTEGWNYINLHCRDNDNKPVDWWYIYKPAGDGSEFLNTGRNFSFMTPDTKGWKQSPVYITGNSMLEHTLAPLFRPTYANYLATVAYNKREGRKNTTGSTALGIMMADELGGLWIGHTIPDFPDMNKDRVRFPEEEHQNGHMITCMSVDLFTLNEIADAVAITRPNITMLVVPDKVKSHLPEWMRLHSLNKNKYSRASSKQKIKPLHYRTRDRTLQGVFMAKSPGDQNCLFRTFAQIQKVILDVYGDKEHTKKSSINNLRNIGAIALKYPTQDVMYINDKTDRMVFAVSTGSNHLKQGQEYWTCIGNSDTERNSGNGGIVMCVHDYYVWSAFDEFKVQSTSKKS